MTSIEPSRSVVPAPPAGRVPALPRTIRQSPARGQPSDGAASMPSGSAAVAFAARVRSERADAQPPRRETHWTRILYCDLFSPDAENGARDVRDVVATLARRGAIAALVCAGFYVALVGLAFALQ